MNGTVWAVTVTIIASAMLSFVGPVSNMADAYSCSSSTSTITGNSASIRVSGTSRGCATSSASTSLANSLGGFVKNGSPTNLEIT